MEDSDSEDTPEDAYERVVAIFRQTDKNGDGLIDPTEFASVLQGLKPGVWTEQQVFKMFASADVNHDGCVNYEEFASWLYFGSVDQQAFCEALGTAVPTPPPEVEVTPSREAALVEGMLVLTSPTNAYDLPNERGTSLAVSLGGPHPRAACGLESGNIILFDIDSGQVLKRLDRPLASKRAQHPAVNAMRFSNNGKLLAVAADMLHIWYVGNAIHHGVAPGSHLGTLSHGRKDECTDCAWGEDDMTIVTAQGMTSKVWMLESPTPQQMRGKIKSTLCPKKPYHVHACCFTPGNEIISVGAHNQVAVWKDTGRGGWRTQPALGEHEGHVYRCTLSPCGTMLLTVSSDKRPCVWDLRRRRLLHRYVGHEAKVGVGEFDKNTKASALGDTTLIVTGSDDATARVWDVETGKCLAKVDAGSEVVGVALVSNASNPLTLCTLTADALQLWDLSAILAR
uniref:EF-hand domain-containing protein n=1 Tax=Pyrodinium bahamense TaxID=73915 RepID=A0A7S0A9I0_9DINO